MCGKEEVPGVRREVLVSGGYDKGVIEAMSSNHQQAAFSEGRQAGENKECRGVWGE